jgi:predicted phage terminase large subunit-like protein
MTSPVDQLLTGLTPVEMAEMVTLLDELENRKRMEAARADFLAFIGVMDATYKFGAHLKRLGALLTDTEGGIKDRVAVSMAPRFGKSLMISVYFPAWYLGRNPDHKVIVASHTADLAIDMARKVRNLMQTAEYRKIFPNVHISADAKAAGKWNTNKGGEYFAVGVGGALAGRGGDLIIIDDPISEQDIKNGNFDSLDVVYEWFRAGLRTRLMPEGRIVVLHTRWHQRDLIGRLLKDGALNEEGDRYEMFEFPAILNVDNPPDHPTHPPKSLWPEQWSLEALQRTRASMPPWQWNAQYMQDPTAQDSAIIKRDWIKWWTAPKPPKVDFIVQSWDTALTTKERSDFSVCQTWGIWTSDKDDSQNVILLNRVRGKWEFPDLKEKARQQYEDWTPDSVIIEAKASGQPLIDEMRRSGIFVQSFSPGKGQDKIARLNAVSDMFASGQVWFPETQWAQEVVEEIIAFPSAEHDDETDTMTLALRRVRQGGLLRLNSDPDDAADYEDTHRRRKGAYTV